MTFDREIPNFLKPDLTFLSLVFGSCEFADQRFCDHKAVCSTLYLVLKNKLLWNGATCIYNKSKF